jgi:GNAT superfamily N-acetyltransferase
MIRRRIMEILEATVADAAEILALQKSAYLFEAKLYDDYTIPPMTQTVEELAGDFSRKTILKAVEDDRIIGSVNGCLKEGRCLIGRLMVHPRFQRQGIGTRLMAAIEAKFTDARLFELFTGELSLRNIRLYERLGYRIIRKERFAGKSFSILFMEKSLENGIDTDAVQGC